MSASYALDFERPLITLESKIAELRSLSGSAANEYTTEILKLEKKAKKLQQEIFNDLTRWQNVQLSRHPGRPYTLDYVGQLCTQFFELEGDRAFGADRSIVGGFAQLDGETVMVIGHQKGRSTKENMLRNFGMPRPEGYRKARRLFHLANRFKCPILTFIDTPGAYPGIGAEERGQSEAIATCLEVMASLEVPIIASIIGEGGSGGALALGVANRVLMMEHGWYSVISPESCSAILYRDPSKAEKVADSLKLTARDLKGFGLIDEIVAESPGGAHRHPRVTADNLGKVIRKHLAELKKFSGEQLVENRYEKFRAMGAYTQSRSSRTNRAGPNQ